MATNFGGVHVGCHCWAPLLDAMQGCCWVPLLGYHCWVPLLAASYQLWRGERWVPLLGAIAGVPLLGAIAGAPLLGCHCWAPLLGRHCWVPCLGPRVYVGIIFSDSLKFARDVARLPSHWIPPGPAIPDVLQTGGIIN